MKRVNNSVIAFNNIIIDEKSWNGLVEDTCTICNTEFENENIHKTGQNHTLNLILKKIEFVEDKFVYRKVSFVIISSYIILQIFKILIQYYIICLFIHKYILFLDRREFLSMFDL